MNTALLVPYFYNSLPIPFALSPIKADVSKNTLLSMLIFKNV